MIKSIRILISIIASLDYEIQKTDVKTTFLNGNLDENIYIVQSEGFIENSQEEKVCELKRSIYGLKQASRSQNKCFDQAIKIYGFDQNINESCVYKRIQNDKAVFLVLYVDDILIIMNNIKALLSTKVQLAQQFDMKDIGEANYILGIQILGDRM